MFVVPWKRVKNNLKQVTKQELLSFIFNVVYILHLTGTETQGKEGKRIDGSCNR